MFHAHPDSSGTKSSVVEPAVRFMALTDLNLTENVVSSDFVFSAYHNVIKQCFFPAHLHILIHVLQQHDTKIWLACNVTGVVAMLQDSSL